MAQEKMKIVYIVKRSMEKAMGKALDLGRVSGMSDRSFEQYEKTIKNDFNRIIEQQAQLLLDQGHISREEANEVLSKKKTNEVI